MSNPAERGVLTFGYYSGQYNNQLHTVTDWSGRVVTYTYDASNRLSQVTDRTGTAHTTYGYDANSFLTTITDANHHTLVTNTNDAGGRVTVQKDGALKQTGQPTQIRKAA